jgi:prepilin-type N-terminal cleavage/methylation domain-containing protein
MKNSRQLHRQQGFTLAELLVSSVVFLLLAGSAFSLLSTSSQRFKTDSQVLNSFQEARLGIDQISRDVSDAGYPPRGRFGAVAPALNLYASGPFGWMPNYPASCTLGGSCTTPTGFDLIIEADYDGTGVKWIRYQLPAGGTTLLRAVVPKVGTNPDASTSGAAVLLPYLQNVMNNATGAQIASIRAGYPAMFPGGNPVPMFTYTCDVVGSTPAACTGANAPSDIRHVDITLIVESANRDAKTNALRLVQLHGVGHRINPNQ